MDANVLFFCAGAAISSLFIAGVVWPLARYVRSLISPERPARFAAVTVLPSAIVLGLIAFALYRFSIYHKSDVGTEEYELYLNLTSTAVSQFALGAFLGPILFYWVRYFEHDAPTQDERKSHVKLTIALCVLVVAALFLPHLQRWLGSATSVEVAQLLKINMEARRSAAEPSAPFTAAISGTVASEHTGKNIPTFLDALVELSKDGAMGGIIERDRRYVRLTNKNKHLEKPGVEAAQVGPDPAEIDADADIANNLLPLARCLKEYVYTFRDHRMFLIDIRPVIVPLNILARVTSPLADASSSLALLGNQVSKLKAEVRKSLSAVGAQVPLWCETEESFTKLGGNRLPYKRTVLAYLLSAIGSFDTAVVELNDWMLRNSRRDWYYARAALELSFVLERALDAGRKDPVFYRYLKENVNLLKTIIPHSDLRIWSEMPSGSCRQDVDSAQLMFTYMTQINRLVKASSTESLIDFATVESASANSRLDLSCFDDVGAYSSNKKGWKAEFLTSYAMALLVSSTSKRLYGRVEREEQRQLRVTARKALVEALALFRQSEIEEEKSRRDKALNEPEGIFYRSPWAESRSTAEATLRSLDENASQ